MAQVMDTVSISWTGWFAPAVLVSDTAPLGEVVQQCNTKNPVYSDGMVVSRKISQLLFGCVVDRHRLNV